MKRICSPLTVAAIALAMAATAWATVPPCPAKEKKNCAITWPEKTGSPSAQCPRTTGNQQPTTCPALKNTCIAGKTERPTCGRISPKVIIKEKEGWKLVVHILQPGTRSQGYHGLLYKEGQRVEGKKGESRETPLGTFTWQGSMDERANLWDSTGWVGEW